MARLTDVGGFTVDHVLGVGHGRRIRALERATRQPLTAAVLEPPASWPRWLHTRVARITAADFEISRHDIDRSLDLLVVARHP